MTQKIAVIGAGYAGLTAALELARAGASVSVFESSRTLGGRARVVEKKGLRLDNGQHILIGGYSETLRMMRSLEITPKAFTTLPFALNIPGRLNLRAASLPAPFNMLVGLLRASGMSWSDRFAMIGLMRFLQKCDYALPKDITVAELLTQTRQTPTLCELIWEPLCISALNTHAASASAQVFANVLRDSIAGGASACDFLIPKKDLTELFPFPVVHYLSTHGHSVHTATAIRSIRKNGEGFTLEGAPHFDANFSHVVLAVAPYHASALLGELDALTRLREQIDALTFEPITTIYLGYPEHVKLPEPMLGASGSAVQFLFDRGALYGQRGVIACVISGSGAHSDWSSEELALCAHREVEKLLPRLSAPLWSSVITEKRATIACTPALSRPKHITPLRGLVLAGDYVDSPYPATIESAVRSGQTAARHILRIRSQENPQQSTTA